ncbi:hypothetical protein [Paraflavitalea pollutisoli]|uniref:hypothetical protein n=1 Tax=Paraflavitalea pollutisoli TaxID=3034143 RepID=UPI0023EBC468|nr:hypothetical protein [Paraflavitalea sp. H1-2-19X]
MKKSKLYFHVPSQQEVYEVTPDCCVVRVHYNEKDPLIQGRNDEEGSRLLNSYDLECYTCHPGLEIIPVSQEFYQQKYREAIELNERRNNAA